MHESNYKLDITLKPMYWSKESLKSWLDFARRPIYQVFVIDSFFGGTIYHSTFMLEACSTTRSRKSNIIKKQGISSEDFNSCIKHNFCSPHLILNLLCNVSTNIIYPFKNASLESMVPFFESPLCNKTLQKNTQRA